MQHSVQRPWLHSPATCCCPAVLLGPANADSHCAAAGDVVGVLWHRQARSITFYKNGTELNTAFTDVAEDRLFPVVRGRGCGGL